MELQSWQCRLIDEYRELQKRKVDLAIFVGGKEFSSLSDDHRELLYLQLERMGDYLEVLDKRLAILGISGVLEASAE